jgi:hypothetical protein
MKKYFTSFVLLLLSAMWKVQRISSKESCFNKQLFEFKNLNVSILIDLSDRIDPEKNANPTMEYFQRDTEYIKAIDKGFLDHIKSKKVIQLDDQMQVFFNPEPSDPQMNDFTKS